MASTCVLGISQTQGRGKTEPRFRSGAGPGGGEGFLTVLNQEGSVKPSPFPGIDHSCKLRTMVVIAANNPGQVGTCLWKSMF